MSTAITGRVASFPQISEFIEDPVMRQQAKYQGYGGGGLTAPTGYYQNMAGRVTRQDGGAGKRCWRRASSATSP